MGEARRGISVCYTTDLRPDDTLADFAAGSDLFVCEGMYGDPESLDKAVEHRHCLFTEAADIASKAAVGELWLTHFSPSLTDPAAYLHHATAIFPRTRVDGRQMTLRFPDGG
jgi:ribonuclease Z